MNKMISLLKKEFVLTEKDEKTNVLLPFEVNEDLTQLCIEYSYSPKTLEDAEITKEKVKKNIQTDAPFNVSDYPSWESFAPLKNLITLSLDSPLGYLGAAHRQAPQQKHIISKEYSSVGFERTEIEKGKWCLTLNVHAIVTEKVEFSVVIWGKNETRMNWFPCELHCHTMHSDGDFSVSELIETAKQRKLKGICLTDHNTMSGHRETKSEKELTILCGIEWTTYFGHMLVLDCSKYVDWRDAHVDTIDEKIKSVHEAGGVVGMAHPFQLGTPICTGGHWDYNIKDFSGVNYMEIWSEGAPYMNSPNIRARELWHEKLSQGYHIAPTMGRDWHRPINNQLQGACTWLLCKGERLTAEKMKKAIIEGRTSISAGPLFFFETDKGETVGDEIEEGKRVFNFTVDSERFDSMNLDYEIEAQKIVILTNNMQTVSQTDITHKSVELCLKKGYYTAELYGKVGKKENELIAFTAPIYVKEKEI